MEAADCQAGRYLKGEKVALLVSSLPMNPVCLESSAECWAIYLGGVFTDSMKCFAFVGSHR